MPRLDALQSLRGIFAIMIFCHHFIVGGESLLPAGGDCGVAFFFVLSGYVMAYVYRDMRFTPSQTKRFLAKRFKRLFPLNAICLALFVALFGWSLSIGGFVVFALDLAMLQCWVPLEWVYFSGNAVAWCLGCFMLFYFLFPRLLGAMRRSRSRFAFVVAALVAVYCSTVWMFPDDAVVGGLYINPVVRLLDCAIGMALMSYFVSESLKSPRGFALNTMLEMIAIIAVIVPMLFYGSIVVNYAVAAVWWLPAAAMVVVFGTPSDGGAVKRILSLKWLVRFGDVSFSFYMLHYIMLRAYAKFSPSMPEVFAEPALKFAIVFAVTTLLAFVVERWIARIFGRN